MLNRQPSFDRGCVSPFDEPRIDQDVDASFPRDGLNGLVQWLRGQIDLRDCFRALRGNLQRQGEGYSRGQRSSTVEATDFSHRDSPSGGPSLIVNELSYWRDRRLGEKTSRSEIATAAEIVPSHPTGACFECCGIVAAMACWTTQIRRLKQLLRRRGQSPEDAEDLVQEAFLRLQAFLNKGNEVQRPEGFLVRTALNLAVDANRRAHRERRGHFEPQSIEDLALVDLTPSPEEVFAAEKRLKLIRQVLDDQVSALTREVFFLHRLEGFTHEEIAARVGISVRAVETHIARAVATIWLERSKE